MDSDLVARCRARIAQKLTKVRSKTPFQLHAEEHKRTHPIRNYPISESCYPQLPPETRLSDQTARDLIAENEALHARLLALEDQCKRLIDAWEKTMQPYHQWGMKLARERLERAERQKTQTVAPKATIVAPKVTDDLPVWERNGN